MNIIEFKNNPTLSPFAPVFEYYTFECSLLNEIDFNWLENFCLDKEKELLEKYPASNHGGTGLGDNSLTTRYPYYTFLDFPETNFIKKIIKKYHDIFIKELKYPDTRIFAQSWINVLRKGEQIKKHQHGTDKYSYLSAHICVKCKNTNTYYYNPYDGEKYASKNEVGKLTLFPSWIQHDTDAVTDNDTRITVAFDIYNELGFKEDVFEDKKTRWIECV